MPTYPEGNDQAEVTNKTVLIFLKKRLDKAKARWVEELPGVLWTYRTMKRRGTNETPFALAFKTKVVIAMEATSPTL